MEFLQATSTAYRVMKLFCEKYEISVTWPSLTASDVKKILSAQRAMKVSEPGFKGCLAVK